MGKSFALIALIALIHKNINIMSANQFPFTPVATHLQANVPTSLYFKENSFGLTGDSGTVKDENGNIVFKIKAKHLTLSNRRTLLDSDGNAIGQFRSKRTPTIHKQYYLGPTDDVKRCSVKLKGMLNPLNCDADIYMGEQIVGKALGNWRAKRYSINIFDKPVASIYRKRTVASTILDADSYCIDIIEGVDTAFITLVTVALDELYHD